MTHGQSWSVLKVVVVTSSLIAFGYFTIVALGLVVGFSIHGAKPKILEIRYVTVADPAHAQPAPSAPEAAASGVREFR